VTVAARFLRDRTRSLIGWSAGVVVLVLVSVAFFPAIRDQPSLDKALETMPEGVKAALGIVKGVSLSSPAGYLQGRMFSILLPACLLVLGISLGTRAIGGFEEDGHLELLLAHPVTRRRVALERWLGVVALLGAITAISIVSLLALGAPFGVLDGLPLGWVVASCVACSLLALFHAALAYAVGCITGRRSAALGIASAVAGGGYLLQGVLAAANAAEGVRLASPWYWYLRRNMLVFGVDWLAIGLPLVLSVVLATVGLFVFERRDLH
jgi:ABC-2 type transport system permease protein